MNDAETKPQTAGSTEQPTATVSPARAIREDIAGYEREYRPWMDRGDGILKRYRDDREQAPNQTVIIRKFNILWSNVETLKPTLYARLPKAAVERRFKDKDEVGRIACEIAERMGDYMLETGKCNEVFKQAVQDRLIPGRAVAWVTYHSEGNEIETGEPVVDSETGNPVKNEDGSPKMETAFEKTQEEARLEYVDWKDFGHSPARTWDEVKRVWRNIYMTQPQLKERFPEKWQSIPLDRQLKDKKDQTQEVVPQATIRMVYDKTEKKVYWVHTGMEENDCILEADDPAVEIEGFWPCPQPLFATLTNGTLIPIADFIFYQDQANELDVVTNRIARITDALKIVGFYDSGTPELARALSPSGTPDNSMYPVEQWVALVEKGGVKGAMSFMPIDMVLQALEGLIQMREQIIQTIYQITGLADIIRGSTNPNETATAQQIKGQFASLRIRDTQADVARFCRDALRIMIECAVQMFEPKTIWDMTLAKQFCQPSDEDKQMAMVAQAGGMPPPEFPKVFTDALALLKDDRMRSFSIDIETDSTIAMDEQQDKQDATEFLGAMSTFIQQAGPVLQAQPAMAPLMGEMLLFAARRYRAGRTLEGEIERTVENLKAMLAQQQQQGPPPNPEMEKVKAETETKRMEMQGKQQAQQEQTALDAKSAQADAALTAESDAHKGRVEAAKALSKVAPVAGAQRLMELSN